MKRRLCDYIYPIGVLALGFLFGQQLGHFTGFEYRRPVKNYTIEDPQRYLFDEVKIFCWVATTSRNHKTKAYAQMATWGRYCNGILFVSNATDDRLPILLFNQTDNFHNLYLKTREAFLWIYKNIVHDYHWFLKADDDTYFHMPNLRHFLKSYSPNESLAFGHEYNIHKFRYHSGGAGYVLSHEAVLRLGALGFNYHPVCDQTIPPEDLYLGQCLMALNASIIDGSDENGGYRFMPIGIWDLIEHAVPEWLTNHSKTKLKKSFSCCSPHFISMNYAKGDFQYFMDYFLHTLKAYGIQHK
uniref:N-acetylgalactosaminide beta-1,3-galactosyltransferase n=1 Tax=Haemonchus contortus TaxID=6289 RepID=A0A7I4YEJ9_HAECO